VAEVVVAVAAIASIVAIATKSVGEGEQLRTASPVTETTTGASVAPSPFGKQAQIGSVKAAPTTEAETSSTAGVLRPSGSAAPSTDAPLSVEPSTAAAPAPTVTESPPAAENPAPPGGLRCIVRLHGKGGGAGGSRPVAGGLVEVSPGGNGAAWGGREWMYFPESGYASARASVASAADAAGCGRIIINGFSNGGAFAAKLYCRGETFGGRLVGVVVDDPVVDHAVVGCAPASGVRIALYWTGALDATALPGWNCAEQDWTCEGGTTIGIAAYESAMGVGRRQSAHGSHVWFTNPPELTSWW
jgi:hypothetical protein